MPTTKSLEGQVAIVTGGNQGIGKGIAKKLAAEGCRLAICARNAEKLKATAAELRKMKVEVLDIATDVSSEPAVEALFEAVKEKFGRVDILVNNAGAFDGGRIDRVSFEGWNNVIGACLTGTFLCSRAAFPMMKKQGAREIAAVASLSETEAVQRIQENLAKSPRRGAKTAAAEAEADAGEEDQDEAA